MPGRGIRLGIATEPAVSHWHHDVIAEENGRLQARQQSKNKATTPGCGILIRVRERQCGRSCADLQLPQRESTVWVSRRLRLPCLSRPEKSCRWRFGFGRAIAGSGRQHPGDCVALNAHRPRHLAYAQPFGCIWHSQASRSKRRRATSTRWRGIQGFANARARGITRIQTCRRIIRSATGHSHTQRLVSAKRNVAVCASSSATCATVTFSRAQIIAN